MYWKQENLLLKETFNHNFCKSPFQSDLIKHGFYIIPVGIISELAHWKTQKCALYQFINIICLGTLKG